MRTHRIYSLNNFPTYHTAVLAIVMLYIPVYLVYTWNFIPFDCRPPVSSSATFPLWEPRVASFSMRLGFLHFLFFHFLFLFFIFLRFHIYMRSYSICFSLTCFISLMPSSFIHIVTNSRILFFMAE